MSYPPPVSIPTGGPIEAGAIGGGLPVGSGGGLGIPLAATGGGGGGPGIIAFCTFDFETTYGAPGAIACGCLAATTFTILGTTPAALRALSTASKYLTG